MIRAGDAVADMAYFTARDGKPSDYCQDAVGRCDVYVGLIGLRYGSMVPDRPQVSYTELEFDAATEAGLTRLIFLLDEHTALPIPPAQLHDDEPDRRARQLAFRDRLRSAGLTVHTVTTPENLELRLYQALLESQPATPEASGPGGRTPGVPQQVWELRGHRPDPYFTGREDDLAAVHRALRGGSATSGIQVITGLGGMGKTRLAVEYAWRHADAYEVVWWVRAEDPATIRGDYVELAQALGLPSGTEDQAIAALRHELRRRRLANFGSQDSARTSDVADAGHRSLRCPASAPPSGLARLARPRQGSVVPHHRMPARAADFLTLRG